MTCDVYPIYQMFCQTVSYEGHTYDSGCTDGIVGYSISCNGGGGGGGSSPQTPNPCTPSGASITPVAIESVSNGKRVMVVQQDPGNGGGGTGTTGGGTSPCVTIVTHDDDLIPKNRLCASTFKFQTIVSPDASQNSRGWKEASVQGLTINVTPDNYFENIWNVITSGSGVVNGTFDIQVGVPGDLPDQAIIASTAWAINITLVQMEQSYGVDGIKMLIRDGTIGIRIAQLAQIQLQSEIPGSRVSSILSGRTTPTKPITGLNCK